MTGRNYYVLTALPTLGEFGSAAPLTLGQLLESVSDNAAPKALLEAVFLSDDLLQWQSFLAGEITDLYPVVMTEAQAGQQAPLPVYLVADTQMESSTVPGDEVWANYFRHTAAVAEKHNSRFLRLWGEYEVTLRNAIADARAKALDLDPNDYLVVTELVGTEEDFAALVNEWSRSENPLSGQRILDKARWDWLVRHDGWFTFDDDELAAYGAKLMLLCRWQRLGRTQPAENADNNNKQPERINA
jgi:hypothetical protein